MDNTATGHLGTGTLHRGSAEALQQGAAFLELQQTAGPTSVSKGGAHAAHCSLSKADCPFLVCFLMLQHEDRSIKEKEITARDEWGGSITNGPIFSWPYPILLASI